MTNKFTRPKYSEYLAFAMGAWIADGYVGKYLAKLSDPDVRYVAAVEDALERCSFVIRPRYTHKTRHGVVMHQITICSKKACAYLWPYKYTEGHFRRLFREYPLAFIAGFFSGDGSVSFGWDGYMQVSMSNKRHDLMLTLRHFIENTMQLKVTRLRRDKNDCYQFGLSGQASAKQFLELVMPFKEVLYES